VVMRICGPEFSLDILERIRELGASVPTISRRALSRRVCEWLDWRSASGTWQEGGCRKALARRVREQVIELPEAARPFAPRQTPNLVSHVLGMASRQLPADWETRYGVRPVLPETFVDPTRFTGSCYPAANWIEVGETAGLRDGVAKRVFLHPL